MFCFDEPAAHDSSAIIEMVARTIEDVTLSEPVFVNRALLVLKQVWVPGLPSQVMRISGEEGHQPPSRLILNATWFSSAKWTLKWSLNKKGLYLSLPKPNNNKADNTVREAKNQYCMTYLNLLVAQSRFRLSCLAHLRKSHTHCRIGGLVFVL